MNELPDLGRSGAQHDPLQVVFPMVPGDIWTDQRGIDWELVRTETDRVHFRRVAVTNEDAIDVARLWRKRDA